MLPTSIRVMFLFGSIVIVVSCRICDVTAMLESVGKTGKAMVVYEDNKFLGLGAEVAAQIAEHALFELDGPIVRIGGPHVPAMPYAPTLEHWFLPDPDRIEQEMRKLAEF